MYGSYYGEGALPLPDGPMSTVISSAEMDPVASEMMGVPSLNAYDRLLKCKETCSQERCSSICGPAWRDALRFTRAEFDCPGESLSRVRVWAPGACGVMAASDSITCR